MPDSFSDLWSSSAPPKAQPQKLGTAPTTTTRRPQQDVFSLLSSAGSSTPSSRSITPGITGQQRSSTPKPAPGAVAGDAFSGLLSGSLAVSNGTRLTIAEQAAQAERQKLESLRRQQHTLKAEASRTWAGLDTLANASPATLNPDTLLGSDDWGFSSAPSSQQKQPTNNSTKTASSSIPIDDEDDWGLHDFGAPASKSSSQEKQHPHPSTKLKSILDLDDLSPSPSSSSKLVSSPPERTDSPGDFDFGNREDALSDAESDEEGDLLGELSKPVEHISRRPPPSVRSQTLLSLCCAHGHYTHRTTIIRHRLPALPHTSLQTDIPPARFPPRRTSSAK
jgi:hypothetical protein